LNKYYEKPKTLESSFIFLILKGKPMAWATNKGAFDFEFNLV